MKKILCLVMCILLTVSLTACFSDDAPGKETKPSNSSEQKEKNETFRLNETAVFDDLKFTAEELKESKGEGFFTPESGKVFVGVKFTVENISDEEQSVSSMLLFEGYVDDVKCDYSFNAACAYTEGTLDGSIAPGKKLVGWYALEVPKNWSSIELSVKSEWLSNNSAKFVFSK